MLTCFSWTVGLVDNNWPNDGEIDIIENVSEANTNLESLHTGTGSNCNLVPAQQGGTISNAGVCDNSYENTSGPPYQYKNQGCGVSDTNNQNTYGTHFNSIHGGVYVMVQEICRRDPMFSTNAYPGMDRREHQDLEFPQEPNPSKHPRR